jgi:hypothetical protein
MHTPDEFTTAFPFLHDKHPVAATELQLRQSIKHAEHANGFTPEAK